MTKHRCGQFEECDTCINKRLDPFQCESCDDASNYEPDEDYEEVEDISYGDFIAMIRGG